LSGRCLLLRGSLLLGWGFLSGGCFLLRGCFLSGRCLLLRRLLLLSGCLLLRGGLLLLGGLLLRGCLLLSGCFLNSRRLLLRSRLGGGRLRRRCLRRGTRARTIADRHQCGAHLDGLVLGDQNRLDDSSDGRGDLGVDFVRRNLEQGLVNLDAVPDLLQPAGDRALCDTLAECREVDGFAHQWCSLQQTCVYL